MQLFEGLQVALDLGINLNFKKKSELRKAIVDNGGTISYIVTRKCHIVVTSNPEKCDVSSKCRMALKYGLPVLNTDFIWDSLSAQKLQLYDAYVVGGKATSLDFKSGKISGKMGRDKKKRKLAPFNPSTVQVWKDGDPAQPLYDESHLEVAKYVMFRSLNESSNCEESYAVELHAPSWGGEPQDSNKQALSANKTECFPYRILLQSGSTGSIKSKQKLCHEWRYTRTADQALQVYAMLVDSVTRKPGIEPCQSPVRGLGSPLLQKKLAQSVGVQEGCSDEVKDLVEHVWREAITEVTALLGKVSNVKLDQVEKADAVLSKISSALQSSLSDREIREMAREFYSILNVKERVVLADLETKLPWKKWLVKKRDLCQLVKDIVSVSEMTNYENQAVVEAKYAALRCRINTLSGAARQEVERLVLSHVEDGSELKVLNVYEVWRQTEDIGFRHDLEPKRLLFHSSRVENFVGILSRGLLLPKVVVDEFGGTRSDVGLLGSGIYFASASSTSVRYSAPSGTKGTRLMLVNEVALGQTKDFLQHDTTLTSAPEGYDSAHGVGRGENKDSEFEVHEYVVYKTNQQRIRYLVEFATADDVPRPLTLSSQEDAYISADTSEARIDVSLEDVLDVVDPMDKLKPGLIGSGDKQVELKGVHIRAKLIDLAGEVVVLQEYHNNSGEAIEAKYVFPLGEMAAVCGFEAFINGKHVVGEVKEKETAHKEYKKAISEGHGAYLMDQDEETPDVFTVSVGNLPAGACVLIKITYVTELRVEDEKITFRLPGTVAPWKEKAALEQTTQTDLASHKTKAMKTSVQVAVEMPFDIRTLHCPTHKVKVKQTASKAFVEMASHQEFGSGFLLLIGLAEIHVPRMWVEEHPSRSHHQACMLTFYPEFELEEVTEGEIIILLDVSNSMKGTQVLKLALLVLQNIPQGFKFNVVRFGSDYEELFPAPKLSTEDSAQQARVFIESSRIDMGSTDARNALRPFYLLPPGDASGPDLPRNVFLLSDGHLTEERLVLDDAARHSWHTRIFTFGVSPTCNSHTLRALSRVSAGAFEYFDPKTKSKWLSKVKSQVGKAKQPGLTSVCVEWQQFDDNLPPPRQAPSQITALFNGSQQIVYGFVPNCTMATLKAVIGGQEVSTVVFSSELSVTEGLLVHRLTARAIIQDWEAGVLARDRTHHELTKMELKDYVIELSKDYSLVTQLTSFVAVEKREENEKETLPKGPTMQELLSKESVENLPYMGWTSIPEPSLESLIEELRFVDKDHQTADWRQETAEKTALLEKFYHGQCVRSGSFALETLQTARVLADSYRQLGEMEKADNITIETFKDISAELDGLVESHNYSAIASCLTDLRRKLSQDVKGSEAAKLFIPWPKKGNVTIKVRELSGKLLELPVGQDTSAGQLKDMIYKRTGNVPDAQRLISQGRQLEDGQVLKDLNMDVDDHFHLVFRLRGGGDGPPEESKPQGAGSAVELELLEEVVRIPREAKPQGAEPAVELELLEEVVRIPRESDHSDSEPDSDMDVIYGKASEGKFEDEEEDDMGFDLFADDGSPQLPASTVGEDIADWNLGMDEYSAGSPQLQASTVGKDIADWDLGMDEYSAVYLTDNEWRGIKKKKKKYSACLPSDESVEVQTSSYKNRLQEMSKSYKKNSHGSTPIGVQPVGAEYSMTATSVPARPSLTGAMALSASATTEEFEPESFGEPFVEPTFGSGFGAAVVKPMLFSSGGLPPQPRSFTFGSAPPPPSLAETAPAPLFGSAPPPPSLAETAPAPLFGSAPPLPSLAETAPAPLFRSAGFGGVRSKSPLSSTFSMTSPLQEQQQQTPVNSISRAPPIPPRSARPPPPPPPQPAQDALPKPIPTRRSAAPLPQLFQHMQQQRSQPQAPTDLLLQSPRRTTFQSTVAQSAPAASLDAEPPAIPPRKFTPWKGTVVASLLSRSLAQQADRLARSAQLKETAEQERKLQPTPPQYEILSPDVSMIVPQSLTLDTSDFAEFQMNSMIYDQGNSPASPAYSPTSPALGSGSLSANSTRSPILCSPMTDIKMEGVENRRASADLSVCQEKEQNAVSKKCHGSVSWRAMGHRDFLADTAPTLCTERTRERSVSRSRTQMEEEDVVSLLSLSTSELDAQNLIDVDSDLEEAKTVKEKYSVIRLSTGKSFTPIRKRASDVFADVAAIPQKKFWYQAPFGIGTDMSPARVKKVTKLSTEKVTKLLQLQNRAGWWQFGAELDGLLGVDSKRCIQVLKTSGLSSLGLKAQAEIQHVLATLFALFLLLEKLLPQFSTAGRDPVLADVVDYLRSLSRHDAWKLLQERFKGNCEQDVASSIIDALDFLSVVDQKYPALYSRLELGSSWFHVAVNLMGPAVVAAA